MFQKESCVILIFKITDNIDYFYFVYLYLSLKFQLVRWNR